MKVIRSALLLAGTLAAAQAFGATWELRRINVNDNLDAAHRYTVRCHFTPEVVEHIAELGSITTSTSTPLDSDAEKIQTLVDQAQGLQRPDLTQAKTYTNWWVRSSPDAAFKLVRTSIANADGSHLVQDDPTEAGKTLSTLMGISCAKAFGQ